MAFLAAAAPALIGAAGSIAGGYMGRRKEQTIPKRETAIQGMKENLLKKLLGSLEGQGQFAGLFNRDEDTFQKSFVEPSMNRFKNQIAPQIQQSFIGSGQEGSSSMEDMLARAGVGMNDQLNQQYAQYKQGGEQNVMNMINQILGADKGALEEYTLPGQSGSEGIGQGLQGYLGSSGFGESMKTMGSSMGDYFNNKGTQSTQPVQRKGFTSPMDNMPPQNDWRAMRDSFPRYQQ